MATGGRIRSSSGHSDNTCDEDGNAAQDGQPRQIVKGSRKAHDQGRNGKYASIQHQAKLVVGQSSKTDLSGKQLTAGREDCERDCSESQYLATNWAEEDQAS